VIGLKEKNGELEQRLAVKSMDEKELIKKFESDEKNLRAEMIPKIAKLKSEVEEKKLEHEMIREFMVGELEH